MRFALRVICWIAASATILGLFVPAQARAHAALVAAEPADGALLASPPEKLWLTFSEEVKPLQLQLTRPGGEVVPLAPAIAGKTLVVEALPGLDAGTHFLSWRVISADGHPVGGTVLFSVGRVTAQIADLGKVENTPLKWSIWLARVALYAALFLGIGGAFFRAWIDEARDPAPAFLPVLLVLGLVAVLASLGLQGLDVLGRSFPDILDRATWHAAWRTSYGGTASVAAASFAAAFFSLFCGLFVARALSLAALLGTGLALAASGHAGTAAPQWLTQPAVFVHGITVALWAGALVPLGLALWRDPAGAASPLRRFSRVIPFAVALLVATGVGLAVVQLEAVNALWTTDYGLVLLRKLILLVPLFALAAFNRWRLTARADTPRDAQRLARVIAIETLLVVAVFCIAAWWRFTPPPRALTLANSTTMVHIHTQKVMAEVTIRPDAPGPVSVSIMVLSGEFAPLTPKEVTLSLSLPSAGIEPIRRAAAIGGDGLWTIEGLVVPAPGRWSLRVDLLISDFDLVTLEQPVDIGLLNPPRP